MSQLFYVDVQCGPVSDRFRGLGGRPSEKGARFVVAVGFRVGRGRSWATGSANGRSRPDLSYCITHCHYSNSVLECVNVKTTILVLKKRNCFLICLRTETFSRSVLQELMCSSSMSTTHRDVFLHAPHIVGVVKIFGVWSMDVESVPT